MRRSFWPGTVRNDRPQQTPVDDQPIEDMYQCCQCLETKTGRFTSPKGSSGHGWSQGRTHFNWHCYDCLKFGSGRGDEFEKGPKA